MAIRERPRLDRAKQRRAEEVQRRNDALVRQALALLHEGESFGLPRREGAEIVLPIVAPAEALLAPEMPA